MINYKRKRQELNPTAFILPPKRTFVNKCLIKDVQQAFRFLLCV